MAKPKEDKYNLAGLLKGTQVGEKLASGNKSATPKDTSDPYNLKALLKISSPSASQIASGATPRRAFISNTAQEINDRLYKAGAINDEQFIGLQTIAKDFGSKMTPILYEYNANAAAFGENRDALYGYEMDTLNMAKQYEEYARARTGNTSVLDGKKGQELRDLKGLNNLYGYDVTGAKLGNYQGTNDFDELVKRSNEFDLQNALLTVEDYYRMMNTPVLGDGMSAARVDPADYEKAAADIETFTGINVRDLAPDKVESVLAEVGGMNEYVDYMQSYIRTQDRWNQETKKQAEYDDFVNDAYAEASADPEFATKSQFNEAETNPLYRAVMLPAGSEEQKKAVTDLGYDWWARVNGIMPLLGRDTEDSYGFEYMTDKQRQVFAYKWADKDYGGAMQYLKDISWGVNKQKAEAEIKQTQKFADDGFWNGALASADSIARNFAGEIEGAYNAGRAALGMDINEYDVGFLNTVKGQVERQTVGENISESTQKLNLFGKNIPQMAYNALLSAADSTLNAMTLGSAASPMMGAGAFNAAFQQNLADGKSDRDAFIDALIAGGIEISTEHFSIEALMKDSTSPLGYFLRNLITEPSEEITGFAVGEIIDNLKNGADSRVNKRIDELRTMGYSPEEAKKQAAREMLADLFETGFTALLSGGTMATGGAVRVGVENTRIGNDLIENDQVRGMLETAATQNLPEDVQQLVKEQLAILNAEDQAKQAANNNRRTEETMRDPAEQEMEDEVDLLHEEETDLEREAEDEENQAAINEARQEELMREPADTETDTETDNEAEPVSETDELTAEESETKAESKPVDRSDDSQKQLRNNEAKQDQKMREPAKKGGKKTKEKVSKADTKLSPAALGRIYRESFKALDAGAQEILSDSYARHLENQLTRKSNGRMPKQVVKLTAKAMSDLIAGRNITDEQRKLIVNNADALSLVNEATGRLDDYRAKAYDLTQMRTTKAFDLAADAKERYGDNADIVINGIQQGQKPQVYAEQFNAAYQYGMEGRNLDVVKGYEAVSTLTPAQIEAAFKMGRDARENEDAASKAVSSGVTVGNVDTKALRNVSLNSYQKSAVYAAGSIAKALKINIKFVRHTANKQGRIEGENGSWNPQTRTLTLDVNAGRLTEKDTNYAIMQAMSHELTHYIKQFADADLWNQYQDFVIGHMSEKMSEKAMDAKIGEYIARWAASGKTLDRDGAIEEIIADASGDALLGLTEQDFADLARTKPGLMDKIRGFIERWAKTVKQAIKNAYKGQTEKSAVAVQMEDALDELTRKYAELLKNAAKNAQENVTETVTKNVTDSVTETVTEAVTKNVAENVRESAKTPEVQGEKNAKKNQPAETGKFLAYGHIDQRTVDTIRNTDTQLFSSEVEEAQIGFAAAAQMLMADVDASVSGQKFFSEEGVTGQKRMTSSFLANMKDATGWTWGKIRDSLQQFADAADGETLPKNTVTNREMELYLDEVLTGGYTTVDGQKVSPWGEYIEAKNQYQGANGDTAPQSAYDGAIDFVDYAFADAGEKYSFGRGVEKQDYSEPFAQRVDQWLAGDIPQNEVIFVSETPDVLKKIGFTSLPMTIDHKHMGYSLKGTYPNANNKLDHTFDVDDFKRLPEKIKNPIAVIASSSQPNTSVVEIIHMKSANGKQAIAAVYVDKEGKINNIDMDTHAITTVHGRSNTFTKLLHEALNSQIDGETSMYYWDKKRAISLLHRAGLQLPRSMPNDGYIHSIHDAGSSVKEKFGSQTETRQFRNWFKDSKIVNADGTPKVMYHGSPNDFTVFDIKKAKSSGLYGKGFYFTDSASHGGTYGKLYEVYLSIQRPLTPGGDTVTRTQVRKFLEAVAENEDDYSIENYGTYDVNEILSSVYRKDAFAVIQDVNATAIGDLVEAVKLFNEVNGTTFDGIVVDTETVAFEPTQIKSATDNIGTFDPENPDIRYQLRDPNQISDRVLLSNVMESAATNEVELDQVKRYRQHIDKLNQKQDELEKTMQEIAEARKAGRRADAAALRSKADILEKQIAREDGMLLKYEAAKPLQAVVARERAALKRKADERVKEYAAKRVETVRKQEAEKRDQKLAELRQEKKDRVKEVRDEKNESFARQKYLKRVNDAVSELRTMIATPTNKKRVPQFLRKPLGQFLDELDFTSKQQLNGGDPTNADLKFASAAAALKEAIENINRQQNGLNTAGNEYFDGYLDLPAGYIAEFDEIMKNVRKAIREANGVGEIPVNKMSSATLHNLYTTLRSLHSSINKMNRLLVNAQYAHADEASRNTIGELAKFKEKKDRNALMQKVGDFMNWKNTVPYYAFKRFGEGGKSIFHSLMDGWDKLAFNSAELLKFTEGVYDHKEVRAWDREIKTIELASGQTVRMSASQLMSLYCLAKRKQALGHLLGGGIRIANIEGKLGKVVAQSDNYTLTEGDLATFRENLSKRQIEVADKLQNDMVNRGAEWGNEISMKRFGYEMFTEQYYFPVESDKNVMKAQDPQAQENSLFRLLNMSATKGLTDKANNAIVIRGIFDVYTSHMSDMAKYNALALPILDTLKWLNYVERTQNKDGTLSVDSVQKSLEKTYGEEARRYIMEFIRNLNGDTEGGREDALINKLTSNYKISATGANLRVGMLQITSLPRAATAISPVNLAKGIAKWNLRPFKNSRIAAEKVGIAKWKSMGFYDTNISRNVREMIKGDEKLVDKVRNISMKLAEWGDAWTMGVLYGAVESELVKTMHPGTEAFDRAVNERMRDIVYRTQVVDSTMTRSHLMRQKGAISSALSFMSEPTLALNMINDALFDIGMNMRGIDGAKFNPAVSKKLAKVMAASTLTIAAASLIEALFTAYRDDDEYEEFEEKFLEALVGDYSDADTFAKRWSAFWASSLGSNMQPLGNVPIVSSLIDAWKNGAAEQMWQAFTNEFNIGFKALSKAIKDDGSIADYYRAIYKLCGAFSSAAGIPVSGAMRELQAIYNNFIAGPMGWKKLQTYDNSPSEAAAGIYDALASGDAARAAKYRKTAEKYGINPDDINDALATRVNDAYLRGEINRNTADNLLTGEAGKRSRQAESTLTKSDYQKATGRKHGDMKEDFISGAITEKQARDYLNEYDGLRDDEIDTRIGEWKYEKETGLLYGSMKADFIDGVLTESQVRNFRKKYGESADEDIDEILGKWKYERDTGLVYSEMKLDYEDGVLSESKVRSYLATYGGKDEEEVEDTISNYDYYIATGRTTSAPKYWRIAYAFDSGADYGAYIDEAFNSIMYGGEKRKSWKQARSQIASSLASYYKNQYLAAYGTAAGEAMLERILDLYEAIGYSRSYQREYIEENWFED